ncbi:MAG: glycosyltransferase family 4 protein [Planctomycetota bacterium]
MTLKVISCLTSGRVSGVDVFATHLTRGLRSLGVDASILLTEPDEQVPDPMRLPVDIPVAVLPVQPRDSGRTRRRTLFAYLESQAPCIYIPNYDYRHSIVSARVSDKVTVVGIVHSDDPMHYDHVVRLGKYWNAVVAVSPTIARKSTVLEKNIADRVFTIPYGIHPPARFPKRDHNASAPLRIIYAGRLEQNQKRVMDFPKILDELERRGVPVRLMLVGSGPSFKDLVDLSERHLDAGRLTILSTMPNHEMVNLYEGSDVFLLTSNFEGLPMSMLEAMSHGCVPVVSDIESGIPEVIENGQNGFRVPVGDIRGYADRLEQLQRDSALRHHLSRRAHDTIIEKDYSVERMARQYAELFERLHHQSQAGQFRRPRAFYGEPMVRKLLLQAERKVRRIWQGTSSQVLTSNVLDLLRRPGAAAIPTEAESNQRSGRRSDY